jgi:hypothetical protein
VSPECRARLPAIDVDRGDELWGCGLSRPRAAGGDWRVQWRWFRIGRGEKPDIAPDPSAPATDCGAKASEGFGTRLVDAYREHLNYWNTSAPNQPAEVRPGWPQPPVGQPQFPYSTWPIGATSTRLHHPSSFICDAPDGRDLLRPVRSMV